VCREFIDGVLHAVDAPEQVDFPEPELPMDGLAGTVHR
jgi:hypothetical protein